jgi:hypothetical protein
MEEKLFLDGPIPYHFPFHYSQLTRVSDIGKYCFGAFSIFGEEIRAGEYEDY